MTLVLDVSAGVNVPAGLGRYSRFLAQALVQQLDEPPTLFYNHIGGRSQVIPGLEHLPTRTVRLGYKPWRMAVWLGQLARLDYQRLVPEATLFHAMEHLLLPLRNVPTVLTVHDLIYKLFPEHHKKLNYIFLNRAMPLFIQRANAIIAISESTKRDLIEHYHTPAEKIHVIYEAPAPHFTRPNPLKIAEVRQRYGLPAQFLLVVGTIEPRKNYSRLIEALMHLQPRHPDLRLVVVGSKGWLYEDFFQRIVEMKASEKVIFPGFVPDDDLPAVYAASTLTVMPSVYEGFGLPVLEAMACAVPVVASRVSSLPELGGNAAHYFDPYQVDEMVAVLDTLLDNPGLRAELGQQGITRASHFSWEHTARATLEVYRQLGFRG